MMRNPVAFTPASLADNTRQAQERVEAILQRARHITEDPDQAQRLTRQFCKACHYSIGMAGQAMTDQPCACCLAVQHYGSTRTDALCLPCAQEHVLCKRCGGDLNMDTSRTVWPSAYRAQT